MFNILKIQDALKNASDEQLAQEMSNPSGQAPQYLIMTEMQRRQKMRAEFSGDAPPQTSMAEEMSGAAPPPPPMGASQGGPPQGGPSQQMPQGDPSQQMPQAMAVGGAVQAAPQFNSVFGGSGPATGVSSPQFNGLFNSAGVDPTTGYSQPAAAPYTPAAASSGSKNSYAAYGAVDNRGSSNPQARRYRDSGLNLPQGVNSPRYGEVPGMNRVVSGLKGETVRYSWSDPSYRDAYIKSLGTPVKDTSANAPVDGTGRHHNRMSDGGPVRMAGGMDVPTVGGPETSGFEDWVSSSGNIAPWRIRAMPPLEREAFINNLKKKSRISQVNPIGNPQYEQEMQSFLDKEAQRTQAELTANRNNAPIFGTFLTSRGEVDRRAKERAAATAEGDRLYAEPTPSMEHPLQAVSPVAAPSYGSSERGNGPGPAPSIPPIGASAPQVTPPPDPFSLLRRKRAAVSAPVSGPPEKAESGIASLPGPKGMSYEDYMKQANELIGGGREDPEIGKNRSFNNALMKLGLGMASSKNPNLLGALAEGGIPALQGYTEDEVQRRKDDRALVSDKLATLGVGAQMSQAEAKAADERAYRSEDAGIRRSEVEARREEARSTAAYRDNDLDLKQLQLQAEIDAKDHPESRRIAEATYGPGGWAIAEHIKNLNVLSDNLTAQQKTAENALRENPNQENQDHYNYVTKRLNDVNEAYYKLSRNEKVPDVSTQPGPLPTAQKGQFTLNP